MIPNVGKGVGNGNGKNVNRVCLEDNLGLRIKKVWEVHLLYGSNPTPEMYSEK